MKKSTRPAGVNKIDLGEFKDVMIVPLVDDDWDEPGTFFIDGVEAHTEQEFRTTEVADPLRVAAVYKFSHCVARVKPNSPSKLVEFTL